MRPKEKKKVDNDSLSLAGAGGALFIGGRHAPVSMPTGWGGRQPLCCGIAPPGKPPGAVVGVIGR